MNKNAIDRPKKMDRRRKYYLVLDCETATLPFASNYKGNEKKDIAIAKPLIYDLGWQVVDRQGRVYSKQSYLISEIFSVPSIFNTGYYADKRPQYLEKLRNNEIILTDWETAIEKLVEDMDVCESVGAYNAMFDFKKAIPFTEVYIKNLYSNRFYQWEEFQNAKCEMIVKKQKPKKNYNKRPFDKDFFNFRGLSYPLFDLWGLTCRYILNCDAYRQMCIDNKWQTASGKFFKSSAETAYRFIQNEQDFVESHTALDDAIIESFLLTKIMKKKASNLTIGIDFFPFKMIGLVENFQAE